MYRVGRIYHGGIELNGDVVLFGIYTRHALKETTKHKNPKPLMNSSSKWSLRQRVSDKCHSDNSHTECHY